MKDISIRFYNCTKNYTLSGAKRFLWARFNKTKNKSFLEKIEELDQGNKSIILGGI